MIKRIISLVILINIGLCSVAYADPIDGTDQESVESAEQTSQNEQNTQASDGTIATIAEAIQQRQEIDRRLNSISELDNQISNNEVEIQENENKVNELKVSIEESELKEKVIEEEMQENLKLSGARIRALSQQTPQLEMVTAILSSKNLSDLVGNIYNVKRILNFDQEVFAKAQMTKEELEKTRSEIEDLKREVEDRLDDNSIKKESLESAKKNVLEELSKLQEEYAKLNISIDNQSTDAIALQAKLQEEFKDYTFTSLETQDGYKKLRNLGIYEGTDLDTPLNFTQADLVMYATQYLGVPYLWGGTTPSGFDCSGFVQYVYKHFGVYLPRVSEDQQNVGVEITDSSQLQTGDLLFYGDPAHHVTMFIQPGYMMEAPRTGDVVKVSSIRPYTRAMRVVNFGTNTEYNTTSTETEDSDSN